MTDTTKSPFLEDRTLLTKDSGPPAAPSEAEHAPGSHSHVVSNSSTKHPTDVEKPLAQAFPANGETEVRDVLIRLPPLHLYNLFSIDA